MKTLTPQIEERQLPKGASFAAYVPFLDRWMRKRAVVGGLLEEASRLERSAGAWEQREHWQMAGRFKEAAARMVERAMDIEMKTEHAKRWQALLREAIVCYAVEIGEAGRYDPAVEFRIYMVARKMGEAKVAAERMKKAMSGFNTMFTDRNLEALVRLNRLKREFLSVLWEGDMQEALRKANEAETVAREIRSPDGCTDRGKDTVEWLEKQVAKRFEGKAASLE